MLLESFKIPSADFKLAEIAPTCQAARPACGGTRALTRPCSGQSRAFQKHTAAKKEKLFLLLIVGRSKGNERYFQNRIPLLSHRLGGGGVTDGDGLPPHGLKTDATE